MYDRMPECFATGDTTAALPLHALRKDDLPAFQATLPPAQAAYLDATGFTGQAGRVVLLPGETGVAGAVLGLGADTGPHVFGAAPASLPPGSLWRLASATASSAELSHWAVLGWAMGAYRFDRLRQASSPASPRLVLPEAAGVAEAVSAARAIWLARDLINMPANLLGPAELAEAATASLRGAGAHVEVIEGGTLQDRYPVVHAVGRGSDRSPAVVLARWHGSAAGDDAPLLSICGKGVCFDTGGYDLKPPSGMLRMKKDMGGAAIALGLTRMILDADWPVRVELRLGCVENMVSGAAMRPLDILTTRSGVTIEVGNTDAEGRLVLCDLLADAAAEKPSILLDFATLTGAARVALGPDLPAVFSNDDDTANMFLNAGRVTHDSVWRLPLWDGYKSWLDSSAADLNNVSEKAHAGAIVAALFLQRFVPDETKWAHFDVYAWNDAARPGLPAGGEAQAMRAAFEGLSRFIGSGSAASPLG